MTDFRVAATDLQRGPFLTFLSRSFFLPVAVFGRVPSYARVSAVIQFVTQTEVLITSFRLICTFRKMKK